MKRLIIVLISMIMIGCSTPIIVEVDKPHIAHPTLPLPVKPIVVEQSGAMIDGKAYVIMDVRNNQKVMVYMEDVLRYIKNINRLVCSYREELNEPFCDDK